MVLNSCPNCNKDKWDCVCESPFVCPKEYKQPKCHICDHELVTCWTKTTKTSYPPYYGLKCDFCGWKGWYPMEFFEDEKEKCKNAKAFKFGTKILIFNDNAIRNILNQNNDSQSE